MDDPAQFENMLVVVGVVVAVIIAIPLLFKLQRGRLQRAIDDHCRECGARIEIEKVGIPPLRYWLANRKGDCWGRVVMEDGSRKWVRHRRRLFTSGSPLTFYDTK